VFVPRKPLKFIHITKTGGGSIEIWATQNGLRWGREHKEYGAWNLGRSPGGGVWHTFFTMQPPELKSAYDWFVVVRNPYDRIMSEFYCPYAGTDRPRRHPDKKIAREQFNAYLQKRINGRLYFGDHYSEQYLYVEPGVHVLHFEELKVQFAHLMGEYGLPTALDFHVNTAVTVRGERFTQADFSEKTIDLIHSVYKKDFELFGYKKYFNSS